MLKSTFTILTCLLLGLSFTAEAADNASGTHEDRSENGDWFIVPKDDKHLDIINSKTKVRKTLLESKLIHGSVLLEANRIPNLVSPCLAEKVRRANSTIAIRHSVLEQKGRYLNVLVYNKPLSSYLRMT